MPSRFSHLRFLALALGLLLGSSRACADPISFHVDIDTSSFATTPGSLEFQFASMLPEPPGSVTLNHFSSDGTVVGSPYVFVPPDAGSFGGALPGVFTIAETPSQGADIGQDFTYGNHLSFDVTLSEPGSFDLFLWGNPGGNGPLEVASSDGLGESLGITVDNSGNVTISTGIGESAIAIPEPATLLLFALGGAGLAVWRSRRRRAVPAG